MEYSKSLKALGLTEESTLQDLTAIFRKLVKKYHPDLNQDNQEWSNQKMILINRAYDSAFQYLSLPISERNPKEELIEDEIPHEKNLSFYEGISLSMSYLNDGIGLFYQYGLENIALRLEGTRRNKYRSSLRRIQKSFSILKPIAELHLNKYELNQLEIIVNFIRHFYKSMHIKSLRPADNTAFERRAFQHYLFGAKLVDSIIKEVMFKEFLESYKLGRLTENIKLAKAEFNTVIIDFPDAFCVYECEIKKELLLSFLDMTDLNDEGLINLY